jgi:transcriptional regulator with XRE-family HTH domain
MFKTTPELLSDLAGRIKSRRAMLGLTQQQAAERSGVAYRTWRRLETEGRASIADLVRAAIALRCEEGLGGLFPQPAAANLDDLLRQQTLTARVQRPGSG